MKMSRDLKFKVEVGLEDVAEFILNSEEKVSNIDGS